MRDDWLKCLGVVAVSLAVSVGTEAIAQPVAAYDESIESVVINADLVFVAKLTDFGDKRKTDRDGEVFRATIEIEETLKNTPGSEAHDRLGLDLPYPESVLADWKKHSCRLLVALNQDASYLTRVIDLRPGSLEVLTADFELLREPDAVVRVGKEAIKDTLSLVRRIHTFGITVPREFLKGTKWESYYSLNLKVPVDERLERKALEGLRSDSSIKRAESVHALSYFKSEENIKRIKPLLRDPGFGVLEEADANNGIEVRHYSVRLAAFRTLKSWGVSVEKPIIREESTN